MGVASVFAEQGSDESRQHYRRSGAKWLTNGGRLPTNPQELAVVELVAREVEFANSYYRKYGERILTAINLKFSVRLWKA